MTQDKNSKAISIKTLRRQAKAANIERQRRKEMYQNKEWYTIRSLLGNQ